MAPTLYRVDRDDTIVQVNDAWDEFARANSAPDLVATHVLHRSLWAFVSDSTTRLLYREIMNRVRARRHPVRVPFRCDSPTLKRFMRMTVSPGDKGALEFEAETLRTEPQNAPFLERSAAPREPLVQTCSWCKRLNVEGEWMEVEGAVARLDLFGSRPPQLTHGICESCTAAVLAALGEPADSVAN